MIKTHIPFIKDYFSLLFKSWFLLLFIIGDLIGLIISLVYEKFFIPQSVFFVLAIIAFGYSGYKIYYEIITKIPDKYKPGIEKLSISLIEGNSYNFFYEKPINRSVDKSKSSQKIKKKNSVEYYFRDVTDSRLPRLKVNVNYRIQNLGDIPLNIISIKARFDEELYPPYTYMNPDILDTDKNIVNYPILINPNEILTYKLDVNVWPNRHLTEAQIAIKLFNYYKNNTSNLLNVVIETSNFNNGISSFTDEFSISYRPLCDMIFSYWKVNKIDKILKLINMEN